MALHIVKLIPREWRLAANRFSHSATSASSESDKIVIPKEFPRINLYPQYGKGREKRSDVRRNSLSELMPPRSQRIKPTQEWSNVWPAAATFKQSVVPLPIRMGYVKNAAPKEKYGNAELMKIPNFLHLTPGAIKKHCQALKKFCIPWPKELATEEDCRTRLPVEIITKDFCHSGPSIRNSKARIVTLRVPLACFDFDYHARDKFLRLIGNRYDPKSHYVTIFTDRCPTKKQNTDYARYLMTALYFESWKNEPWEKEKTAADMEKYFWEDSRSKQAAEEVLSSRNDELGPAEAENILNQYKETVDDLLNTGEDAKAVERYKKSVKILLGLEKAEAASS